MVTGSLLCTSTVLSNSVLSWSLSVFKLTSYPFLSPVLTLTPPSKFLFKGFVNYSLENRNKFK